MSRVRSIFRAGQGVQFLIGIAVIATLAGLAATVTTEIVMVPTSSERTRLYALIVALAAVTVTIGAVLRLFAPRSLSRRMLIASLSGPVLVAIAVSAGSQSMFLSEHDLNFLLILLAFATILAIGVVHALARPLTDDLAALTDVARRVGAGDLSARAELERMDEVGELASALDMMIVEIATTRAQRDASERERSLTLASLSHDARTPLTSMRLATEALLDGVAPDPERYLRTIAADIDAVENLIADLFTIGQLEAGRLVLESQEFDLVEAARDVAECLSPIGNLRSVTIDVVGADLISVVGDPTQLHRALLNVASNAVRHSPDHGRVEIRVEEPGPRVSVTDDGPGFAIDFIEAAFQPFRRHDEARDRAHGGAGLGLAVAKGIVDASGGRIWAEPGPGGRVHLDLAV
ncbi:MAG: sensor histidine kinase [Acidimicrobiales bacterium]